MIDFPKPNIISELRTIVSGMKRKLPHVPANLGSVECRGSQMREYRKGYIMGCRYGMLHVVQRLESLLESHDLAIFAEQAMRELKADLQELEKEWK